MMPDLEKVIKGLDTCRKVPAFCCSCPYDAKDEYDGITCESRLIADAIELLKAQQPRVLTVEEVDVVEVCWMEQRGHEPYATLDAYSWNHNIYNKWWRCWSAKPTDEQREAVKWDA